ncbi:MAG: PilZ domain-containing protein [Deltaproteobacteria bacterium]|nr:PilZ domain-containing protein [Deltaproteobacteria bacterium]
MMVLVVGDYRTEHAESMTSAIRRAFGRDNDLRTLFVRDVISAKEILSDPDVEPLRCIFIDGAAAHVEEFIAWMRGQEQLFSVPIFALVPHVCDQAFRETNGYGADDTLGDRDMGAITRRMAVLEEYRTSVRPPITAGNVVIAHSDQKLRRLFGKTMRNAGFNLIFASDEAELMNTAEVSPRPKLVIAEYALTDGDVFAEIERYRANASDTKLPFVLLGRGSDFHNIATDTGPVDVVELMSDSAPPDNLLFLTNELLRRVFLSGKADQRASERLLYGTLCAFRHAGDLSSAYGYCYNISFEGMYVKTFDPPRIDSEIWLEMRPPGEIIGVHLRGTVVWVRLPDNSRAVTVPPGFGLRIDSNACPPGDLEKYRASYKQLRENRRLYYPVTI